MLSQLGTPILLHEHISPELNHRWWSGRSQGHCLICLRTVRKGVSEDLSGENVVQKTWVEAVSALELGLQGPSTVPRLSCHIRDSTRGCRKGARKTHPAAPSLGCLELKEVNVRGIDH